jgi:hypothetical protein
VMFLTALTANRLHQISLHGPTPCRCLSYKGRTSLLGRGKTSTRFFAVRLTRRAGKALARRCGSPCARHVGRRVLGAVDSPFLENRNPQVRPLFR